jgi:4-oxalocrotonate tautomerase
MPSLTVHLGAPLAPPGRRDLARALTALTVRELGKRGELTAVRLVDVDPADWFVGGEPAGPTAWLAIDITAGTNDAAQKARFIAEAHELLRRHLSPHGDWQPASYVLVHEWPGTDWGWSGLTQAERARVRAG